MANYTLLFRFIFGMLVIFGCSAMTVEGAGILVAESGREPIVLVHGYLGPVIGHLSVETIWTFVDSRLKRNGFSVHQIVLENKARQDIRESAGELREFIQKVLLKTGALKVDLVCHSEGGLVARYYIERLDGAGFVDDLVTISTPHRGTTVAAMGLGEAARQMEVFSDFLRDLNREPNFPGDIDYTAIHSNHDEVVLPAANGFLEGAVNINVNFLGHLGILVSRDVYRMARGALTSDIAGGHRLIPIEIQHPRMTTNERTIALKLAPANHLFPEAKMNEMRISDNMFLIGARWEPAADTKNWSLDTSTDGLKAVYVQYREKKRLFGSEKKSPVYVDYIFYDSTKPAARIEVLPEATSSGMVQVRIEASDNSDKFKEAGRWNAFSAYGIEDLGVREMMISTDPAFRDGQWQTFSDRAAVGLGSGKEQMTVYLKVRDGAGNESDVASITVSLLDLI